MDDYIYRVDVAIKLKNIQDAYFRAKRWENRSGIDYPHKLMKNRYAGLSSAEGIYLICFYTSQQRAETSLINDFSYFGDCKISRCHKEVILGSGFIESWDDGFPVGEAYLFWCQETLTSKNTLFSSIGISLEHFETLNQGEWIPLTDYIRNESPSVNTSINTELLFEDKCSTNNNKAWWKFWL
ncbi:TPA: hypothetical protein JD320_000021 [Citrobacter koseri]|uniref:hypothetical protein n=1 Tax=Citrobacter koseri TaxID=545 RepID=UPI001A2B6B95|nr:hypothetical protein [Citrobacter koseri]HDQ2602805.1 hypothetical protein [Citrobacter koseri]